jgi:hypothetical protein
MQRIIKQSIKRPRVQCTKCSKYFAIKADGNPWTHTCAFQFPARVQAQPVQAQPVQAQPVQPQPVQPQPVQAQPVQAQPLSEKNEKYIETILGALTFEKEKITHCFKEQESLDSIRQDLNDGLYLELCNNLMKEVKYRGQRISNYEKLVQDLLTQL